jgi:hypothetical protein
MTGKSRASALLRWGSSDALDLGRSGQIALDSSVNAAATRSAAHVWVAISYCPRSLTAALLQKSPRPPPNFLRRASPRSLKS